MEDMNKGIKGGWKDTVERPRKRGRAQKSNQTLMDIVRVLNTSLRDETRKKDTIRK